MVPSALQTAMRKYGLVLILALVVLLIAIVGGARILEKDPKPVQGLDRSAASSTSSQSGLDAVTKENVEDTSMTVN